MSKSRLQKEEKQETVMQVRVLLAYQTAKQYRQDLQHIFTAYLETEKEDWQEKRAHLAFIYEQLDIFFDNLSNLASIDRYKN